MQKLYFLDTGIRNYSIKDFREIEIRQDKGTVVETMIFSEIYKNLGPLDEVYYWRTQQRKEVDFVLKRVGKIIPIEVKYRKFAQPHLSSSLKNFIRIYKPEIALVLNRNLWEETRFGKTKVIFAPVYSV
jgi:hypothetical protein